MDGDPIQAAKDIIAGKCSEAQEKANAQHGLVIGSSALVDARTGEVRMILEIRCTCGAHGHARLMCSIEELAELAYVALDARADAKTLQARLQRDNKGK